MSEEEIFNKFVEKSIGNDKVSKKDFKTKKASFNGPLALLIGLIITTSLTGCFGDGKEVSTKPSPKQQTISEFNDADETYGVDPADVYYYRGERLEELLEKYGFIEYTQEDGKRNYIYSADDYKKIEELDDSYLRAMYFLATPDDVNEMAKSLGYENIDDFMIKKGYVDEEGKPDHSYWAAANYVEIAKELSENNEKGVTK